jgi:hypothetical protein
MVNDLLVESGKYCRYVCVNHAKSIYRFACKIHGARQSRPYANLIGHTSKARGAGRRRRNKKCSGLRGLKSGDHRAAGATLKPESKSCLCTQSTIRTVHPPADRSCDETLISFIGPHIDAALIDKQCTRASLARKVLDAFPDRRLVEQVANVILHSSPKSGGQAKSSWLIDRQPRPRNVSSWPFATIRSDAAIPSLSGRSH